MVIAPIKIETLASGRPWTNWAVMAVCGAVFFLGGDVQMEPLALDRPFSLVTSLFYHAHVAYFAYSLLLLWVFGNVLCRSVGAVLYLHIFLASGVVGSVMGLLVAGAAMPGAVGAAHGVAAAVVALYPLNEATLLFLGRGDAGVFHVPLWMAGLGWLGICIFVALLEVSWLPWWPFVGGMLAGSLAGVLLPATGLVERVRDENPTLWDLLVRLPPEDRG